MGSRLRYYYLFAATAKSSYVKTELCEIYNNNSSIYCFVRVPRVFESGDGLRAAIDVGVDNIARLCNIHELNV